MKFLLCFTNYKIIITSYYVRTWQTNFKTNAIPNGLEKYLSLNFNNKLVFIDSFEFLSPSLETLVKNLSENAFKLLSQEFDNKILDLVKRKGFYPYEYMSNFVKFYEHLKFGVDLG